MEEPDVILDLQKFKLFTYVHTLLRISQIYYLFFPESSLRPVLTAWIFCIVIWSGRKGRMDTFCIYLYKMDSTKYIYKIG